MDTLRVICSRNQCPRQIHAKGLCEMHYRRLIRRSRHGSNLPEREQRRFVQGTDEQRFLARIVKKDCWHWQGAKTTSGYGEFQVAGKTVYTHRWSYEFYVKPIPIGLTIDHLCCIRNCANPKHLEVVTLSENSRRVWARKRQAAAA